MKETIPQGNRSDQKINQTRRGRKELRQLQQITPGQTQPELETKESV